VLNKHNSYFHFTFKFELRVERGRRGGGLEREKPGEEGVKIKRERRVKRKERRKSGEEEEKVTI